MPIEFNDNTLGQLSPVERRALLKRVVEDRLAEGEYHPVAPLQEGLWFLERLFPGNSAYHLTAAFRLRGPLSVPALERALNTVLERHSPLRTTFIEEAGGVKQRVRRPQLTLEPCWVESLLEQQLAQHIRDEAAAFSQRPFDLTQGPLIRARLYRYSPEQHLLLVCLHHLCADAWSIGIMTRELAQAYRAYLSDGSAELPVLTRQYSDFIRWHRSALSRRRDSLIAYWKALLLEGEFTSEWPTDFVRPAVADFRGAAVLSRIPNAHLIALQAMASEERATLFMVLLACFQIVHSRYAQADQILTATPVSLRDAAGAEDLIGMFVNVLPLRTDLRGDPDFRTLLGRVRSTIIDAVDHRDLPFDELVRTLGIDRELSRNPLVQTLFALQEETLGALSLHALDIEQVALETTTVQFDLAVYAYTRRDGLEIRIDYSTALFTRARMERLSDHFGNVIASVAAQPAIRLSQLSMLDAAEKTAVLELGRGTHTHRDSAELLHEAIARYAAQRPTATAVIADDTQLSYRELDFLGNRFAQRLRALGLSPSSPVGVCLERSANMITALVGVLKAGNAYLPMDPEGPTDRLQQLARRAAIDLIVTERKYVGILPPEINFVCIDDEDWLHEPTGPLETTVEPSEAAYVIYTSGSTGGPKGVVTSHRAIVNRLEWMQRYFCLRAGERVLQKTPYTFDVSVWEIFWPLREGACVVIARPGGHRDPKYLARLIQRCEVSTVHFVPSMLQAFLDEPEAIECRTLRRVVCSGEALLPALKNNFFRKISAELYNLYGPTEAAVDVTAWKCEAGEPTVPIGKSIDNMRTYVLDQHQQLQPRGIPGELYLAGVGLARGYVNAPAATAQSFVPDPHGKESGARMYRTGDICRIDAAGALEYIGRRDSQIKLRGFRIDIAEIEAVLLEHPRIQHVAVVLSCESPRLIAYWVARSPADQPLQDIKSFARARLPEYMVPAIWMQLDQMPLSASGKLSRRLLPKPDSGSSRRNADYVPPRTPTQKLLAEVWAAALNVDSVSIEDNFFDLGGDSLLSIRLLSAAARRGLNFSLQQFYLHQTVASLAATLEHAPGVTELPVTTTPFSLLSPEDRHLLSDRIVDAYPLSLLQAGMFFHGSFDRDSDVYHNVTSCQVEGPWNPSAFDQALQDMARAHPALRTSFALHGYSKPLQLVHSEAHVPVIFNDLRNVERAEQARVIAQEFELERSIKFDITQTPLLRFRVYRRGLAEFQVMWTEHHAILDGWSVAAMHVELFERYSALCKGSTFEFITPSATYRDAIALEIKALESRETREYWRNLLQGAEPFGISRQIVSRRARLEKRRIRYHDVPVSEKLSADIRSLASRAGVSVKSVALLAHVKALSILSGRRDVVTGFVVNQRPEHGDADRLLGLFLNTMPFRFALGPGTWLELAQRIFAMELEMMPHRWFPLPELLRMLDKPSIFEPVFNFTHFHVYQQAARLTEFRLLHFDAFQETNLSLIANFSLDPLGSDLRLRFDYDPHVFAATEIDSCAGIYLRTLEQMAATPDRQHDTDYYLTEQERHEVVEVLQGERADYGAGELLQEVFARRCVETPQAVAVSAERVLSYLELDRCSNQLAHDLRARGVGLETRVGICLERSWRLVVGILGILKCGAAYVPLDPVYPRERLEYMSRDSGLRLVVSESGLAAILPQGPEALFLDEQESRLSQQRDEALPSTAHPENAAYVIYTSGSTGQPKGVVVSHRAVWRLFAATAGEYGFGPQDVWTLFHSYAFDFSVWEIWGALLHGGRLVVVPYCVSRASDELYELLKRERVTVLCQTPTAFGELMRVDAQLTDRLSLRIVILGGEALDPSRLRSWFERHGDQTPRLVNMYGITETTVHVTYRELHAADAEQGSRSPVGRPLRDLRVYVLDGMGNPVPRAVTGELYVGGAGLARGYLERPQLTAERFLPDPFSAQPGARMYRSGDLARWSDSGELEFLGRADQQVKIRGFRVELAEIEATLLSHAAVQRAAVIMISDPDRGNSLAAYVVPETPSDESLTQELREFISRSLPTFMVPSAFVLLDRLPLTSNGKLDRAALPSLSPSAADAQAYVSPESRTEITLAAMWARTLGVDRVGLKNDFFELGGHSVLATRLVSEVNAHFGIALSLRVLFEGPTIAQMAGEVDRLLAAAPVTLPKITPAPRLNRRGPASDTN